MKCFGKCTFCLKRKLNLHLKGNISTNPNVATNHAPNVPSLSLEWLVNFYKSRAIYSKLRLVEMFPLSKHPPIRLHEKSVQFWGEVAQKSSAGNLKTDLYFQTFLGYFSQILHKIEQFFHAVLEGDVCLIGSNNIKNCPIFGRELAQKPR